MLVLSGAIALSALFAPGSMRSAMAQAIDVPLGGTATISNGTECAPNAEAQVYLTVGDNDPLPMGQVTTDADGHFEVAIPVPSNLDTGPGAVVIDCGIEGSVLIYEVEFSSSGSTLFSLDVGLLAIVGAGVLAVFSVVALVWARRSRSAAAETWEPPANPTPAEADDAEADAEAVDFSFVAPVDPSAPAFAAATSDAPSAFGLPVQAGAETTIEGNGLAFAPLDGAPSVDTSAFGVAAFTGRPHGDPETDRDDDLHSDEVPAPAFGVDDVETSGSGAPGSTADSEATGGDTEDDPCDEVLRSSAVASGQRVAEPSTPVGGSARHDDDDEDDEGADYWFWDVETPRGPARRLACLTENTFHLDEVPVEGFSGLLGRIAQLGPETALARSFVSVRLEDVDGVYRRGTEIKISYRNDAGNPVAKTVDLGAELNGVLDLLSRRFVVHQVPLPV